MLKSKRLFAYFAFEHSCFCMYQLVSSKCCYISAVIFTFLAFKWSLSSMWEDVVVQRYLYLLCSFYHMWDRQMTLHQSEGSVFFLCVPVYIQHKPQFYDLQMNTFLSPFWYVFGQCGLSDLSGLLKLHCKCCIWPPSCGFLCELANPVWGIVVHKCYKLIYFDWILIYDFPCDFLNQLHRRMSYYKVDNCR